MKNVSTNSNITKNTFMNFKDIDFHEVILKKIDLLQLELPNSKHLIKKTLELIKNEITALNKWQSTYNFTDEAEEIYFYKIVRPSIISQFLYYQAIYECETEAPLTDAELADFYHDKYLIIKKKLERLNYVKTYLKNEENSIYLIEDTKTNNSCLPKVNEKFWRPCLKHCIPIAEYKSYELQLEYLKEKYIVYNTPNNTQTGKLIWNRNLTDFSELVFALFHTKAFGEENITIKKIVTMLMLVIDVDFGNDPNRRWRDIAKRKIEPVRYLKELVESVKQHISKTT